MATAQATAKQSTQSAVSETQKQLKLSEAEITRMRDELKRAQNELLETKAEHTHQIRQAVERESGLWDELVEVRGLAVTAKEKASGYRRKLLTLALLFVLPAIVWAAIIYQPVVFAQTAVHGKSPDAPVAASSEKPAPENEVAKVVTHDFSAAVDRLDDALGQFRDRPEDVLRRVHDPKNRS